MRGVGKKRERKKTTPFDVWATRVTLRDLASLVEVFRATDSSMDGLQGGLGSAGALGRVGH